LDGIQLWGQNQQAFRDKKVMQYFVGDSYEKETNTEGYRHTNRKRE
jgi:hypothetical protein